LREFHIPKSPFASSAQTSITFQTSVTFRTSDLRKARPMVPLPIGGYAVFVDVIKGSPRCPKCGEMMALRIIEPERSGFDLHTFECPRCYDTEALVVSISREFDVPIAQRSSRSDG
jgi:predicted RNA-binding Zn-ribbon protein involved in translation (DUF1610 family)